MCVGCSVPEISVTSQVPIIPGNAVGSPRKNANVRQRALYTVYLNYIFNRIPLGERIVT